MTTVPPIIDEAEALVRELAAALTRVHDGECLCCYVARQLADYPCDHTHRHAVRYRDAMAPRATALEERLSRVGACCCDCELFLNGYEPNPALGPPRGEAEDDALPVIGRPPFERPSDLPLSALPPFPQPSPCAGVRRGSVRPCENWVRIRRW